ncbi:MAG: hypothetical protein A2831_03605 [Candidatus Yanofskybacteria bacterium RIFCSPHIGHO2_01_FULL_44_17]|uniref:Uncharacterized protein n=1 Tax=Candidatus Yanofskybacteria bacterium RIFCSPHIGHO2_01_FULL_44_17 TaxID=1802668 RepID=A0A1F8EZ12_9BACT|nr:MAG: hypothetical protein A2831_03605 [Candidatus Yanofskybacteria bacterium RIFCSPHIGHO2_01_FULL_44_17]
MPTVASGMHALALTQEIFRFHDILLMEFIVYQCEEKPHFTEAKKINPKATRSVAKALQHTPDFTEPTIFIQNLEGFETVGERLTNLKEIDASSVNVASYLNDKKKPRIHEAMKVVSKVKTRNGIYHIPLLDLDIPVSEGGPVLAEEVFRELGIKHGAILNSGASYHGWGLELLTDYEWRYFMARALLLDRIDRRWIGHRLLDGQANLRISEKRGKIPEVVYAF